MISEEETRHNPHSDVRLNIQKSAEAIVPGSGKSLEVWENERRGKGRTMGVLRAKGV